MDYRDRHVVVTGGAGALGTAVVGALIEAGAVCHVPYINPAEAERFAWRNHARVKLVADIELTHEAAVARFFDGVPQLWASIQIAGGFAMAPVAKTTKSELMQQIDMNFVTAFLCCRASVNVMIRTGAGGRIVNVASRPALEWREGAGHGGLYRQQGRSRSHDRGPRRGGREGGHSGQCDCAVDHGHPGEPSGHAQGRPCRLAEGRGGHSDDHVPGVAGQSGHPRRRGAGIWQGVGARRRPQSSIVG